MKYKWEKIVCLTLAVICCLSVAACGSSENAGGLGTITMDDSPSSSFGVGTLGGSDGNPNDGTDKPNQVPDETPTTPAPDPTPTPAPAMETELYECDCFTMTIPKGWKVEYTPYDAGDGAVRIIIAAFDPEDTNNRIFFASALEPYFISNDAKNAWLPYMDSSFEWAPVIEGDPSAEKALGQWPTCYTLMQAQGGGFEKYFSQYHLEGVYDSGVADGSTNADMTSSVLAQVSIPGAAETYDMYFQNELVLTDPPSGIDSSAKYYIGWGTRGIVIKTSQFDACYETLANCLWSMDNSKMVEIYGGSNAQGITGSSEDEGFDILK